MNIVINMNLVNCSYLSAAIFAMAPTAPQGGRQQPDAEKPLFEVVVHKHPPPLLGSHFAAAIFAMAPPADAGGRQPAAAEKPLFEVVAHKNC